MANFYSNSATDKSRAADARATDERSVRSMYESAPYPGLGDRLKDSIRYLAPIRADLERRPSVSFLDVGCGTGHILVGVAKQNPQWSCVGIDLSEASLDVARQLAAKHGVKVSVARGSYLDALPFDGPFDVISAAGTIHHCADPLAAMQNLRNYLKGDGYLLLHLYGMRCDQEKFDIKEALSIMEPDLGNYETRFGFFRSLIDHRKGRWLERIARTSARDAYATLRDGWRNYRRRQRGITWSPSFREHYPEVGAQWIDHFCHPCERAYEVPEVQRLVEQSRFKVHRMIGQGSEQLDLIPARWRSRYSELSEWEKYRLSELLSPGARSFSMILQPA